MKKIIFLLFVLCLCSCASNYKYTDGENIINYIINRGAQQENGLVWIESQLRDNDRYKDYVMYNPSNETIGVAVVCEDETWSETARKTIVNNYNEIYGFFKPGSPRDATYLYYHYTIDYRTLEKVKVKATFNLSKDAFDLEHHTIAYQAKLINLTMIEGDEPILNDYSIIHSLKETFDICKDINVISKMPFLF